MRKSLLIMLFVSFTSLADDEYDNFTAQKYTNSCGSASVSALLKYWIGYSISEDEVIKIINESSAIKERGHSDFNLLELKNAINKIGYKASINKIKPDQLSRLKRPVILLINQKTAPHYVMLLKVVDNKVYVLDGALGKKTFFEMNELIESSIDENHPYFPFITVDKPTGDKKESAFVKWTSDESLKFIKPYIEVLAQSPITLSKKDQVIASIGFDSSFANNKQWNYKSETESLAQNASIRYGITDDIEIGFAAFNTFNRSRFDFKKGSIVNESHDYGYKLLINKSFNFDNPLINSMVIGTDVTSVNNTRAFVGVNTTVKINTPEEFPTLLIQNSFAKPIVNNATEIDFRLKSGVLLMKRITENTRIDTGFDMDFIKTKQSGFSEPTNKTITAGLSYLFDNSIQLSPNVDYNFDQHDVSVGINVSYISQN